MDQREIELIEKNLDSNPELKSLWEDHILLSKQVEALEANCRTPEEKVKLSQLKKRKLEGKSRIADILDTLRG